MIDLGDLLAGLLWFASGVMVGWVAAYVAYDVHQIRQTVDSALRHDAGGELGGGETRPRPARSVRAMGIAVVVMCVITVTAVAVYNLRLRDAVRCQARVNATVAEANAAGARLVATDATAAGEMWRALLTIPSDWKPASRVQSVNDAVQGYLDVQAETNKARAALPAAADLPDCGAW